MMRNQRYFGVVDRAAARELRASGYDLICRGNRVQVFGSPHLASLGQEKVAVRGEVWHAPMRDSLQLYLDTERIIKKVVPFLREEIRDMLNPDIQLNYAQKLGHGHSLRIRDAYKNENLDIHVSVIPTDPDTWIYWRLTSWTEQGRDILEEGQIPYPDKGEWDEDKQHSKAVQQVLKAVRAWLKDRS